MYNVRSYVIGEFLRHLLELLLSITGMYSTNRPSGQLRPDTALAVLAGCEEVYWCAMEVFQTNKKR